MPSMPCSPSAAGGRAAPTRSVLVAAVAALALIGGACTGGNDDDRLGSDTTPMSDRDPTTGSDQRTDGLGEPDIGALDRLTYAGDDRPILDPDNIPDVPEPDLAPPDERLPKVEAEVADAIDEAVASPDVAILDVAGVIDDGPSADEIASFGDGNSRSPSGELLILDEPASLACADVEIAIGHVDGGRTTEAERHAASAAERSAASSVAGIEAWSRTLGDAGADPVTLVGFLSICVDGGYTL